MTSIFEVTIIHHVIIVFGVLWLLNSYNCCNLLAYFISLMYLYLVHERYEMRLRKKLQFEERRYANQKRALADSETVRWLNHAVEKIWPICMEKIVSQQILLPLMPWFLQKYKPWTVKEAVVQQLYLGRTPPMLTDMRVLRESSDDDHLVLEVGISFQTADDMSGIIAAKLTKRLGLGMWAKMHLVGMHVEGKVLVGVKFLRHWPYLGRMRICFVEPPYFQMMVKPLFNHGIDVTELPGVAGWLDKLLSVAFEQTLVEPNMLVVDVEKFVSPEQGNWFSVDVKEPIAYAVVEVLEADEMKPSDLNGLADPYVKGQLGPYRFRTKTQKKTLSPKWQEEFRVPICTWESSTLKIEVRDKDHLVDDKLGDCSINTSDLRDGQRHDMWLPLQNIKVGRLHLAITIVEANGDEKVAEEQLDEPIQENDNARDSSVNGTTSKGSFKAGATEKSPVVDKFEPIDVEGQRETGIWVQHPGTEVTQVWEPRKGKNRVGGQILGGADNSGSVKSTGSDTCQDDGSSTTDDESVDVDKPRTRNPFRKGLRKISSVFHRSPKAENKSNPESPDGPSPHANVRSVNNKAVGIKFVVDDPASGPSATKPLKTDSKESSEGNGVDTSVKDVAKGILKHAEKTAHEIKHVLSKKMSKKSRGSERDISLEGVSSDEGSVFSPVDTFMDDRGSVVSSSLIGSGNNSFNSKEGTFQPPHNSVAPNAVETEYKVEATNTVVAESSEKREQPVEVTTGAKPAE